MIQYVYVCNDELPMYVFMYLFLQYLHHDLWLAGLWWGKKELWMSLELFFPPPLWDSITLSFCCFKYCSSPQGVICKLSFSTFMITVRLLTNYKNYSVSHLRNIVINWFVLYVQVLHLCKDLVFQHYSHDYTITQQGEHFWLLQIAPFFETCTLV